MELLVLREELAYAEAPCGSLIVSRGIAQSIIDYGNETLKGLLPGIARGEIVGWQGLSEPNAGSDLLALETKAVEEDDCYVLNGQKTWSSNAHLAQYGFVLARTDTTVARHRGLSMFVLDNKLPGVTIRPLINMAGNHHHNEVFLDNVRVPKEYLLGEKNKGFNQLLAVMEVDRFWGRFCKAPYLRKLLEQLVQYCKETWRDGVCLAQDPIIKHKLAESAIEIEACRLLFYKIGWLIQRGLATYETGMGKALADETGQRLLNKAMQILGPYSQLDTGTRWAPLHAKMQRLYLLAPGHSLAGGTSEMVRNMIALRGLGLPR